MFSRKKPEVPKRRNRDLSQFGLFNISDDFDPSKAMGNDDEDDGDLEAELAAIAGGNQLPKPKPKEKKLIPAADLDRMIAESLKDVGSDEDDSDDDDASDPALLGELQDLTGEAIEDEATEGGTTAAAVAEEEKEQVFLPTTTISVIDTIQTRIKMYELAEKSAKETGESVRARRFNRGLKTLNDLLKQATAGKTINVDDIPPEVSVKGAKTEEGQAATDGPVEEPAGAAAVSPPSPPSRPAPAIPTTSDDSKSIAPTTEARPKLAALNARKDEYKRAALEAKRAGDKESALQYIKILRQFDVVIKSAENGEEVDLSDMPPPPSQLAEFLKQMEAQAGAVAPTTAESMPQPVPEPSKEPEPIPDAPKTIMEALLQRLDKYRSVESAAKEEANSSKARRYGRIVKQYEDAIKLHKAGKPVAFDELPVPPGFGPLPTEGSSSSSPASLPSPVPKVSSDPEPGPSSKPSPPPRKPLTKQESVSRISGNQVPTTLVEKQMALLLQRQKEFKIAAIEAKKAGEIAQAKEYLKIYKGFEGLLNAASGGLPVDLSTLPIPPSQRDNLEDSFAFVSENEPDPNDEISDISVRMEEHLAKQLMMCKNTRDHHRAMGDVAGMNRFENLALSVQKDLDLVRYSRRKKLPIPKFHYEQKSFNIVHCNTDLNENEVEVNVIRGMAYNVPNPNDVDTYVKVEFPYPQENPFKAKTSLVKNTDNPDYDEKFKIEIQRSNRQCQRVFKRHAVKFEVYSRGGFLRSDVLIGTVSVKLQPLETKCEFHDSFNLMNGRKAVGGKLEVKIRVRNPILTKQIEHVNEKWLVVDA